MALDQRLFYGVKPSRKNPFIFTFDKFYYPDKVSEDLVKEIHEASTYRSESWWKQVDNLLCGGYDQRCFLPIGVIGTRKMFNLCVTHSSEPEDKLGDINGYLSLVLDPWAFDANSKNYILMLYYPHKLPVFLIRGVNRKRDEILVAASYRSECWGKDPPYEYGLEEISNLLQGFSIIREFEPPNDYEPLKNPKRIKFGIKNKKREEMI